MEEQLIEPTSYSELSATTIQILSAEEKSNQHNSDDYIKKGIKSVGIFFKKGWKTVKEGAQTVNTKFKETKIGKKATESIIAVANSPFSQKVKTSVKSAGIAIKNGLKRV